jgi:lysyl-tRNA synthetase, class II
MHTKIFKISDCLTGNPKRRTKTMEENHLIAERKRKLEELKKTGINPFAYSFDKKESSAEVSSGFESFEGKEVSVAGRLLSMRDMGKICFAHLQDSTGKLQLYFSKEELKEAYSTLKLIDMGDIIGAKGKVFKTKTGEVTVHVESFELLTKSLRPLPEKWHGLKDPEARYRQRYVDLIVNPEVKEVFMKRAKIYKAIRGFLDKRGFTEVNTPILQAQYGGANARPFVTKINAWDMRMYLRIAYELHLKRLIVGGFEKIYDLSSCFRNEGVDKTHNPEFAMMEIQWAYADYNDVMKLTEELYEHVAKEVLGTTIIEYEGKKIDFKAPWKRLTMVSAIKELAGIDVENLPADELRKIARQHKLEVEDDAPWGIVVSHLFELCEPKLIQPTFIIDPPIETCPLAKPHRKDPRFIERVEPFINGWEAGNGYSELTDPLLQRKEFEEQVARGRGGDEEAHPMDEDYVQALEYGLPPNAGMGIGIDRMVILMTGAESIRDVTLFPIMRQQNPDKDAKEESKKKK